MKKIAVIGGGWYGCHIALVLKSAGHDVTLFENHEKVFKGISGKFGIRLHTGPHYPRSEKTRKSCREGYAEFIKTYPDLVIEHAYSIYGLGTLDANNEPPKIDLQTFRKVGKEVKISREIDPKKWGYVNLQSAFDIEEPSILLGDPLRKKFETYLQNAGVKVVCNAKVNKLIRWKSTKTLVLGEEDFCFGMFDYAVNTTSYHALLPPSEPPLPFELNIVYQPCLALVYEDRASKFMSLPPFSFIVMDGWFPCIMPYITGTEETANHYRKYIVTHGKYTIMGSYKTVEEANTCLTKIDEKFITTHIQPKCESEMERFWPLFGAQMPTSERRFQYVGYKAAVLAKIKTNREFRSAVTFAREGVIYIIPGKVSNIFDAGRETLSLINNQNILYQGTYQYVKNGALDDAVSEITEAIDPKISNTCTLQTYAEITSNSNIRKKAISVTEENGAVPKSSKSFISKLKQPINRDMAELTISNPVSFFQLPPKMPKSSFTTNTNNYNIQIRSSL